MKFPNLGWYRYALIAAIVCIGLGAGLPLPTQPAMASVNTSLSPIILSSAVPIRECTP